MTFDLAEYEARLEPWSDMQGHMPFLRDTAASYSRPVIIELGVRSGQSTACFLAAIQAGGGELWSVDVDPPQVPAHWHGLPEWHFLQADDVSAQAREWLPAQCDLLFIDTSHTYEQTMTELSVYVPRVRPGGMVLCHDTEWAHPGTMLDAPAGPVTAALDQWCGREGVTWANRHGSYGMGMIRR